MKDKIIKKQKELIDFLEDNLKRDLTPDEWGQRKDLYDALGRLSEDEQKEPVKSAEEILKQYLDATDECINIELIVRAMEEYAQVKAPAFVVNKPVH